MKVITIIWFSNPILVPVCAVALCKALTLFCQARDSTNESPWKNSSNSDVLGPSNSSKELSRVREICRMCCRRQSPFRYLTGLDFSEQLQEIEDNFLSFYPYVWTAPDKRRTRRNCSVLSSRRTRSPHLWVMLIFKCWAIALWLCTRRRALWDTTQTILRAEVILALGSHSIKDLGFQSIYVERIKKLVIYYDLHKAHNQCFNDQV